MIKRPLIILSIYLGFAAGACAPAGKTVVPVTAQVLGERATNVSNTIPRAQIYKTNGDFNHNVAISLSSDGKTIVSYPAPSDVSVNSEPVALADGYLLDRRGIGRNTAFLDVDYQTYSKLKSAPSLSQLMDMVLPDAKVTALVRLPMTPSEALADTAAVNRLIRSGLPGCTVVFAPLVLQSPLK